MSNDEQVLASPVEEADDPLAVVSKSIRSALANLDYQATTKDPKSNGYAFAKVPDWALRQWLQRIEESRGISLVGSAAAISASPAPVVGGSSQSQPVAVPNDGLRTPGSGGWFFYPAKPQPGRRIVAIYSDGSGAQLYWCHENGMIDSDGDDHDDLDDAMAWTYLPAGFKLWCENRHDDPFVFPSAPNDATPNPASEIRNALRLALGFVEREVHRAFEAEEVADTLRAALKIAEGM